MNSSAKNEFIRLVEAGPLQTAEDIIGSIEKAANVLPSIQQRPKTTFPWNNDDTLKALFLDRKTYHIKKQKREYRETSKKIKKRVTHLRNEFYAKEAEEFNDAASRREVETKTKNQN